MQKLDSYQLELLWRVNQRYPDWYAYSPERYESAEDALKEEDALMLLEQKSFIETRARPNRMRDPKTAYLNIAAKMTDQGRQFIREYQVRQEDSIPSRVSHIQSDTGNDDQSVPTSPTFSGRGKILLTRRLGNDWGALADLLEIPPHEQRRFPQGDEGRAIWEWLELRNRLVELPDVLQEIERDDLAREIFAEKPNTSAVVRLGRYGPVIVLAIAAMILGFLSYLYIYSDSNTKINLSVKNSGCWEQILDVLVNNNSEVNELFTKVELEPEWIWGRFSAGAVPPEEKYEVNLDEWIEFMNKIKWEDGFYEYLVKQDRVVKVDPSFIPYGRTEDYKISEAYIPENLDVTEVIDSKFVSLSETPERFTIKMTLSEKSMGWYLDGSLRLKVTTDQGRVLKSNYVRFSLCNA